MPRGESTAQYKNLTFDTDHKPSFLRNIGSALSGQSDPTDRPPLPTRPDHNDCIGELSEDEHGDEKPQIIVLNPEKHLDQLQADAAAQDSSYVPPKKMKKQGSLKFASSESKRGKRKVGVEDGEDGEELGDIIKRVKTGAGTLPVEGKAPVPATAQKVPTKELSKAERKKVKEERKLKDKRARAMLSFDDG